MDEGLGGEVGQVVRGRGHLGEKEQMGRWSVVVVIWERRNRWSWSSGNEPRRSGSPVVYDVFLLYPGVRSERSQ